MSHPEEHHAVIGAGLVGSLWALILANKGYRVSLYDRRPDPRLNTIDGGRSINLALSDRGWRALEIAGVASLVREIAMPVNGRRLHSINGDTTFQSYGSDEQCIYSVSRAGLNMILLEAAEKNLAVKVLFDHPCSGYSLNENSVSLHFKGLESISHDRVFGTDGIFSAIRGTMTRKDRFDYSQAYLPHGYKEIEMQPNTNGGYKMAEDGLHIWPRGKFMFMALPNPGGSFTCTLFAPFEGKESFENIKSDDDVLGFFKKHFPDSLAHLPNLIDDWNSNPVSSMCTVKCYPWNDSSRVALLGDSAHAIVPFYGQGMNCGFEDCSVLSNLIDEIDGIPDESEWENVLGKYSELRKPAGDAILDLALHNYIVMRDKTMDPVFQLQKKIESLLTTTYPERWKPLYSLVTFTHTPYQNAWRRGQLQQAVMNEVMSHPDIESKWNSQEIMALAIRTLDKFEYDPSFLDGSTSLLSLDV